MLQRPTTDTLRAAHANASSALASITPPSGGAKPKRAKAKRAKRTIRSLLTPEQMNLAIHRESARVDRKDGRALVLVLFRFTGSASSPSTMRLAKTILHRIRVTDDVGWFDEQHVGVLLPETAPAGAWRLAQHVCDRAARRGQRAHVVMYSYGGDGVPPSVVRQAEER